jgi:uncharacterized protein YgiM (DUF1202 family)
MNLRRRSHRPFNMGRLPLSVAILCTAAVLRLDCPSNAAAADPFYPITRYVRESAELHQQPSFDARISVELEKGARLTLIDQQGEWFVAKLPNARVGWIHNRFLTGEPPAAPEPKSILEPEEPETAAKATPPPEPKEAKAMETTAAPAGEQQAAEETAAAAPEGLFPVRVKVASGRIRTAPNLEAPIALGVSRGETASVVETEDKWYRIRLADGRTGWGHRMLFSKIDGKDESDDIPATDRTPPADEEATVEEPAMAEAPALEIGTPIGEKILYYVQMTTEPGGREKVVFRLGGFYPPETFVMEEGEPKVVCDFMGIAPGEALRRRIPFDGKMIRRVRIGVHADADPKKVRAVVDLTRNKAYSVEQVFVKGKGEYILTFTTTE